MEYIYGALLLHKLGKPVNEENLKKLIQASGSEVDESKIKSLVVSIEGLDLDKEIENSMVFSTSASTGNESKVEEKKEEKKEEVKTEEAAEGLASLFG